MVRPVLPDIPYHILILVPDVDWLTHLPPIPILLDKVMLVIGIVHPDDLRQILDYLLTIFSHRKTGSYQ